MREGTYVWALLLSMSGMYLTLAGRRELGGGGAKGREKVYGRASGEVFEAFWKLRDIRF